jgi:hypothetical protein
MKTLRFCLFFLALSVLILLAPNAIAGSGIVGTAIGGGTIPAGQYQGQTFTVTIKGEYSGYGLETFVIGQAKVTIGTEVFTSVVFSDYRCSFCCGNGASGESWFGLHGLVLHETSAGPHYHLFGASASTGGGMCFNISDQSGTTVDPTDPPCDPGVGLICFEGAVVHIGPSVLTVQVDIKPGSFPNPINPKSRGVIPVAIMTTATFDALTVDPLTVKFGPAGAVEAHGKGHPEDVDGDGKLDLVLHFGTQESGIKAGDVSAGLTGKTFAGQDIAGSDAIVTVGGGLKKELVQETPWEQSTEGMESTRLSVRAYPNPFNPSTIVEFSLPKEAFVTLKVYNSIGAEVAVLVNDLRSAGIHTVRFDAENLAGGVYFLRLQSGGVIETNKMILLK